jgi:hypothetical protein
MNELLLVVIQLQFFNMATMGPDWCWIIKIFQVAYLPKFLWVIFCYCPQRMCTYRRPKVQIIQYEITELVGMLEVMDGRTCSFGTAFLKCQTVRIAGLLDPRLRKFYCTMV